MKINKSQIARKLKKACCTIDKYLKGYKKSKQRTRSSYLAAYYDIILVVKVRGKLTRCVDEKLEVI